MAEPNPNKFSKYELLPNGEGFKTLDGNIYKFDKSGGWLVL